MYDFHVPSAMNAGTSARSTDFSGAGTIGSRARVTAMKPTYRVPRPGTAASRSQAIASSMPRTGAQTIATRPSMTDSNSGFSASSAHGPGSTRSVCGRRNSGPRESSAAPNAVTASAFTRGRSHRRTTMPRARRTRGQP